MPAERLLLTDHPVPWQERTRREPPSGFPLGGIVLKLLSNDEFDTKSLRQSLF
ncbi:hypothetical protein [Synechococcus sp. M16CYN]|uniref:hypothetical protein n=1 Tax=Synechococcus sp. M16CYN TaxID=3103139 RepID=UPI00333FA792